MCQNITHSTSPTKVTINWCLAGSLESLPSLLDRIPTTMISHVTRDANKVAYRWESYYHRDTRYERVESSTRDIQCRGMSSPWIRSTNGTVHYKPMVKRIHNVTWILRSLSVKKERTMRLEERWVKFWWSWISEILDFDRTMTIMRRRWNPSNNWNMTA